MGVVNKRDEELKGARLRELVVKKESKSKKKARRKLKLQEEAARAAFLDKIKKEGMLAGKEILDNPSDEVKMSQVILDFVAPLLEASGPEIPVEKLIGIATIAWNLALIPEEEHPRLFDEMAGKMSLDPAGVKEMNDLMKWLIERKKKHFDEHRRQILDYRVSDLGDRHSLQVVSSGLSPNPQSEQE